MGTARDIALIFLSLQALVISLIPLALIGGLAYGIYRLNGLAKTYLQKAQVYAEQGRNWTERTTDAIAAPLVKMHAVGAGVAAVLHQVKVWLRR